jgi:hypothetical protein
MVIKLAGCLEELPAQDRGDTWPAATRRGAAPGGAGASSAATGSTRLNIRTTGTVLDTNEYSVS